MGIFAYVFGDLKTGQVIYTIPCRGVDINAKLNGGGDLRGTFSLDMTGYSNAAMLSATIPGLSFVIVEYNNTVIWDGFITSRWYQSQAKTIQFYAKHISAFPSTQRMDIDFVRANVEQTSIFVDLWNLMQSDPLRNINVTVPTALPNLQLKSCNVHSYDYKSFLSIMTDISDGLQGFDWTVSTAKSGGAYVRTLRFGYPHLMPSASTNSLVFEYPGAITNYYATESDISTRIVGLGNGSGSDMLTSSVTFSDIETLGLRMDGTVSLKEISNQIVLNDLTQQYAAVHKPPGMTISATVLVNTPPIFGSYDIGSAARVIIKDSRFSTVYDHSTWITAWNLKPSSSNDVGTVNLTFAGDDGV